MKATHINFDPDGTCLFIYNDDVAEMMRPLGEMEIRRASHVEPYGNGWTVDLSPVGGPLYGPFETREFALHFEVEWLKANRGL